MSLSPTARRGRTASGSGRIVVAPLEGYADPGVFENVKQALHDLEAAQQDARDHPPYPRVVKTLILRGQLAAIATTNLYLPLGFGIYRLAVIQVCTTAGSAGTIQTTIGWTDEAGAATEMPASALTLTATGGNSMDMPFVVAAGTVPITYATTVTGATGSPVYALYLALERLA